MALQNGMIVCVCRTRMYENSGITVKYTLGLIKWFNANVEKHQASG